MISLRFARASLRRWRDNVNVTDRDRLTVTSYTWLNLPSSNSNSTVTDLIRMRSNLGGSKRSHISLEEDSGPDELVIGGTSGKKVRWEGNAVNMIEDSIEGHDSEEDTKPLEKVIFTL